MANIKTSQNIDWVQLKDQASRPTNPSAGFKRVYSKTDGLYVLNSTGVEVGPLGTGGAGAGGANFFQLSGAAWTGSGTNPIPSGGWYATEFTYRSWEMPFGNVYSSGEMQTYGSGGWNLESSLGGTSLSMSSGDRSLLIPRTGLYLLSAYGVYQSNGLGSFRKMAIVDARDIAGQNQPLFFGSRGKIGPSGVGQWFTADSKPPLGGSSNVEMNCTVVTLLRAGTEIALIARHDVGLSLGFNAFLNFVYLQDIPTEIAGQAQFMSFNSSPTYILGFHSSFAGGAVA